MENKDSLKLDIHQFKLITNGYKIYVDIWKGKNYRQFKLLTWTMTSLIAIGQFVHHEESWLGKKDGGGGGVVILSSYK